MLISICDKNLTLKLNKMCFHDFLLLLLLCDKIIHVELKTRIPVKSLEVTWTCRESDIDVESHKKA